MSLTQVTTGGVDENINIDSNTLKVDGTNNRVGIGTSAPETKLQVNGEVQSGSNPYSSGSYGVKLENIGRISVRRAGATDITFASYPASGSTPNVTILGNGSATFSGNVLAQDSTNYYSQLGNQGRIILKGGQSGNFLEGYTNTGSGVFTVTNDGTVIAGGNPDDGGAAGCRLWYGGAISSARTSGSSAVFSGYTVGNSTPQASINANGDAKFLGNVGINNSSPGSYDSSANNLVVGSASGDEGITIAAGTSSSSTINFADGTSGSAAYTGRILYQHSANALTFHTNGGTERVRIKSDGTLHAIKSGTQITNAEQTVAVFQRSSGSGSTSKISIVSGNAAASHINFGDTDDEDVGQLVYNHSNNSMQFLTSTSERMRLDSSGNLGVGSSSPGAKLDVNGNVLLSAANPKITFNTGGANIHAPAANTLAFNTDSSNERVRLTSNGFVNIGGYTIPSSTPGAQIHGSGNLLFCVRSNTGEVISFHANSTSKVGNIVANASSTTYNTSSDHRLKENVVALSGAIDRVKQLLPKRFNFIIEPDTTVDGFLAHEAQTVVPEAITGTHNEVDDNNNPVYQGIDQSKLVPLLTAALQEAITKIETLETKVAALEAAG